MRIDWNAVAKIGIPGVIAMFLVFRLAQGFDMFETRLKAIESQHEIMSTATTNAHEAAREARDINKQVLWVLQVMCVNEAKTPEARRSCMNGANQQ